MRQQGEPHRPRSHWNAMVAILADVPNFEVLYKVPATHSLVAVRSRSRGGSEPSEYWMHEEYDPVGRLVALYENFEEVNAKGQRSAGWRKFDDAGGFERRKDSLVRSKDLAPLLTVPK